MSFRQKFIDAQWRWMKIFFVIWPFWCALIVGLNIWHDVSAGLPFNWLNLAFGLGIALFGGVVYYFSRLIFRFVTAQYPDERERS